MSIGCGESPAPPVILRQFACAPLAGRGCIHSPQGVYAQLADVQIDRAPRLRGEVRERGDVPPLRQLRPAVAGVAGGEQGAGARSRRAARAPHHPRRCRGYPRSGATSAARIAWLPRRPHSASMLKFPSPNPRSRPAGAVSLELQIGNRSHRMCNRRGAVRHAFHTTRLRPACRDVTASLDEAPSTRWKTDHTKWL